MSETKQLLSQLNSVLNDIKKEISEIKESQEYTKNQLSNLEMITGTIEGELTSEK